MLKVKHTRSMATSTLLSFLRKQYTVATVYLEPIPEHWRLMMSKVRLGVIGAGSWSVSSHLPNLASHDDVEFVAVARKGPELLAKIKHDFGFRVASEDYRDVLDAGIDICVVAS